MRARAAGGLVVVVLAATGTACGGGAGDLGIRNGGPTEVTVSTGDEEVVVSAEGGAVLLEYGCTPGDVTVAFPSGESVVVPGPVCPEQEIVVGDGRVELRPA